jgi:hypothetical protein
MFALYHAGYRKEESSMKTYHTPTGLRIVGKGFEVRWQLKRLLDTAVSPQAPLMDRLNEWKPDDRQITANAKLIPFPSIHK